MSKLRFRVQVSSGSPDLFQDLLGMDSDGARGDRIKYLAELGLLYLKQGAQPAKDQTESLAPHPQRPAPAPLSALSSVKRTMEQSLGTT